MKLMRWLTALCLLGITGLASATNYTLWISGRTGGGTIGDYDSFTYWGPSSTAAGVNKNPSDWFCNDLTLGTSANQGGSLKWSNHSVSFRDDSEAYNHYTNGNWQGIVSVVRSAMVNSAL